MVSCRPDLVAEANVALSRVGGRELRRMEALGVPLRAIAQLGERQPPFGLAAIEEHRDGTYTPIDQGRFAIIVPVAVPVSSEAFGLPIELIDIIDLIAFRSDAPTRWHWRTGDAWALGSELLDQDAPITLVAHPLAWLAEGGEALCLLDWSMSRRHWHMLRGGPPLMTNDPALRSRLNAAHSDMQPPLVGEPEPWKYRKGRLGCAA